MKKSLYLTSALVAASVIALGSTSAMAATKAKPMTLGISGFYTAVVGYSDQDHNSPASTAAGTSGNTYSQTDVKTNAEVHFKGSTKMDNGLSVGVTVELEADQTKNGTQIDASYMTIGGGFGTVALGSAAAASAILAVNAPSTGAIGIFGDDSTFWINRPAASKISPVAGANIGGGEDTKVRWTSPTMSGFQVGGSYVPETGAANAGAGGNDMPITGGNTSVGDQTDVAIKYSGKMGANAIAASVTYWTRDAGTASTNNFALGASTTMGAFTVGLGYKDERSTGDDAAGISMKTTGADNNLTSKTWNAGVQWTQGKATVSANYFKVEMPLSLAVVGNDELRKVTVGAKYAMGPGVDFLASVQNVQWSDELPATANKNKGYAIVGGIGVKF
jgi:outer membrane protein OmpU